LENFSIQKRLIAKVLGEKIFLEKSGLLERFENWFYQKRTYALKLFKIKSTTLGKSRKKNLCRKSGRGYAKIILGKNLLLPMDWQLFLWI
jgi:hypothetical protein